MCERHTTSPLRDTCIINILILAVLPSTLNFSLIETSFKFTKNKGLRLLVFNYKDKNVLATIADEMRNIIPLVEGSHRMIDTQPDPYRIPLSKDEFEENFDSKIREILL